jgi:hypothetical protein
MHERRRLSWRVRVGRTESLFALRAWSITETTMTDATRVVRWIRLHPGCSPREVATAVYVPRGERVTVGHVLSAGMRLSRLAAKGVLTRTFDRGWKYRVAPSGAGGCWMNPDRRCEVTESGSPDGGDRGKESSSSS